ncbi:MAG: tetratricopeptide repeat protein [Bacteroidota bacterium]
MYKNIISVLIACSMLWACQTGDSKAKMQDAIKKEEKGLYSTTGQYVYDPIKANHLIELYKDYATRFPKDSIAPDYLFKRAEMLVASKKFTEANQVYEQIIQEYPSYKKTPVSLFMEGFNYENNLNDLSKARQCYEKFIQLYPSHKLREAAEISLTHLGKSADEIVKEFEAKKESIK